jgi:dolichol-phosphate mannosyltransferase
MKNLSASIVIARSVERTGELVARIRATIAPSVTACEIIIVDEETSAEPQGGDARDENNHTVRSMRMPQGSGRARVILAGIEASKYDKVAVVSAEWFSPEAIPNLLASVQNGADIAIGSRRPTPDASGRSDFAKRLSRKSVDLFVRTIFRELRSVTDIESGLFALRKDVVTRAHLNPVGDNILLELLVQGTYDSVSEVECESGRGDVSVLEQDARMPYDLRHLASLFWRSGECHRFLKFAAVGAVGAVLNLAVLYALTELGVFYLLSGLIGIEAGLLSNFILNRSWTFRDRQGRGLRYVLTALYRDHAVRFVGIVLNLVILWFLTSVFGVYYLISQVIGIAVAMLWNYGGNQWWTWEHGVRERLD